VITYVSKEKLYPAFGICYSDGRIEIREDLPQCVKDFLVVHETYHSTDTETIWWKRELKANWAGLLIHPVGFFVTLIMSLSPARLKLYVQRWATKQ
jgi:hypothetical protein